MTLLDLLRLMRTHLKVVVALPVVCAVAMAAVSFGLMRNVYSADTTLYVQATSEQQSSNTTLYADLNASQMIANDVASLAKSDTVLSEAAKGLGLSEKDIKSYGIEVTSTTTSRVIQLTVTGKDPAQTADVANAIASSISKVAKDAMGVAGVNAIDSAKVPSSPSGPNRPLYTAVAFLAGLFVAIAAIVIMDMVNTRVRGVEDAERTLGIPVIGRIPAIKMGR